METLGCCIKNIETKSKVVSMVDQIKENILSYSLPVSLLTAACNTVYIGLEYLDKDTLQQTCFDFFAPIMDVSFTMKILNKIKKEIFYFFSIRPFQRYSYLLNLLRPKNAPVSKCKKSI